MIPFNLPASGALEEELWKGATRLDFGELMSLQAGHVFERTTTPGLIREEYRIRQAEEAAGQADPDYDLLHANAEAVAAGLDIRHKHAISREEWEASPLYREKIQYTDNMTPVRAQILADIHDRREHEAQLIALSADSLGRKAGLLGMGLLASLPDPVNLIPVAGTLGKGASLGRAAYHGAKTGVLSSALADAVIFPVANARGEDFGAYDVAMDILGGAVIGGGLGALGHAFSRWLGKGGKADIDAILQGAADGLDALRTNRTHADFALAGRDRFFDLQSVDFEWIQRQRNHAPFEAAGRDRFLDLQEWEIRDGADRARFENDQAAQAEIVEARQSFADSELARLGDEASQAANRLESRLDMVEDYVRQLEHAGYSPEHAKAYGIIHAAHAEVMAPIFGQTPREFLNSRLAGFEAMTPQEFQGLAHLGDLEAERNLAFMMQEMGVKPGMSKSQKRRLLQPEFEYAWGKVNPESFKGTYGPSVYNEMRKQFGPGFFSKKGEGFGMDELAANFEYAERGGYELNASDISESGFAERVMMPHDAFEADMRRSVGAFYQAAMSKSDAANVRDFVDSIPQSGRPPKKFFHFRHVHDRPVELPASQAQHVKQNHPGFTEWERIPDVIEKGEATAIGFSDYAQSPAHAYVIKEGNEALVVLAADVTGNARRRRPSRHVVLSAFRDNAEKVTNWLDRFANENAASPSGKSQTPPGARQTERPASLEPQSGESTVSALDAEVNSLLGKGKSFEQRERSPRGGIRQLDDGRYIVGLFKNKDASTVLHESGHFFLENLREASGLGTAPQWVRDSWGALQKHYGFDNATQGEGWRTVQERFAREFEAYAREGKAPAPELQTAFAQFRDWLTAVYRSVKKLLGGEELTPETRDVFDRLLASENDLELARNRESDVPQAWAFDDHFQYADDALDAVRENLYGSERAKAGQLVDVLARDLDQERPLDALARAKAMGMSEPPYMPNGKPLEEGAPRPDWTPEAPERQAPPATPEERALADRAMDAEAERLIQEGHATPEERALLEQHQADMDAVTREEEAALSVLSCIVGAA